MFIPSPLTSPLHTKAVPPNPANFQDLVGHSHYSPSYSPEIIEQTILTIPRITGLLATVLLWLKAMKYLKYLCVRETNRFLSRAEIEALELELEILYFL
ncbi:hypothetical protein TNCT_465491 [Trichonephila clavata]|uniref:Uncharacterized protein n=1 Tax=Trichonephila clavata TaxID=2740835 RepID=A0A8X6I3R6_TRICU|nr:hypothetical protein TNCT_465491 [Trichonephila clavata]